MCDLRYYDCDKAMTLNDVVRCDSTAFVDRFEPFTSALTYEMLIV